MRILVSTACMSEFHHTHDRFVHIRKCCRFAFILEDSGNLLQRRPWNQLRRPQQNASAGTDHGAAGCAFVIGTRAAGTMIGEWPGLASGLDPLGNLRETADFRALYCALLEQWLGHDAAPIIPGAAALPRPQVVK